MGEDLTVELSESIMLPVRAYPCRDRLRAAICKRCPFRAQMFGFLDEQLSCQPSS